MICGGKAEDLASDTTSGEACDVAYGTPSGEEDEYEGDIDEYVLGGGEDDDEEAKVGTHEDSSSTYIHVCIMQLIVLFIKLNRNNHLPPS